MYYHKQHALTDSMQQVTYVRTSVLHKFKADNSKQFILKLHFNLYQTHAMAYTWSNWLCFILACQKIINLVA